MDLILVRHLWGVPDGFAAIERFAKRDYFGIECPLPADEDSRRALADALRANQLFHIGMAFTQGESVAEHVASFRKQLDAATAAGCAALTLHGGRDAWDWQDVQTFYGEVCRIEADAAIPVRHETHRGRVLFNPWATQRVLETFAPLRLCCDYSHWVVVAERLLGDCDDILDLAASRCDHLHARVGYPEGPQVPDPAAPEYADALTAHDRWWKAIFQRKRSEGTKLLTVTPEFGPPGYMHTLPHANTPVADLEQVCEWMAGHIRQLAAEA